MILIKLIREAVRRRRDARFANSLRRYSMYNNVKPTKNS